MAWGPPSAQSYAKNTAAETNNQGLTSQNQAAQLFGTSFPAFQQAVTYYQQLASGNPATVNTAVAPQVNQVNDQYAAATQAAARNLARGGAQADTQTQLQLQKTGQIAGAKSAAVAGAPAALESAGTAGTQLSQNAVTNALNAFASSTDTDLKLLPVEAAEQQQEDQAFGTLMNPGGASGGPTVGSDGTISNASSGGGGLNMQAFMAALSQIIGSGAAVAA